YNEYIQGWYIHIRKGEGRTMSTQTELTKTNSYIDPSQINLKQLALPILTESILRSTVGMVNVAFLSRISDGMVSAVSVSNQYITICQMLATAVATGTIVCINQAIGMHNNQKMNRMATVAVGANLVLGLLFGMLFFFFSNSFLSIMNLGAQSIEAANTYMRIAGSTMVIQCVEIVVSNICRSMGKTKAPLMINLLANGVNLLGCYFVVFQPLPILVSPVVGVAWISVFSRTASLCLALYIVSRTTVRIRLSEFRPFPKAELKLALSIGIPGGLNNLAYSASQLVTTALISQTGAIMVATKVYVTNLVQYVALVGMACAHAATIMIGYRVGAGQYDEACKIRTHVTRIALISNVCFSLLLMTVRVPLLKLFIQDEAIIGIASVIMLIDVFVEIGRALNNTVSGSLQAAGDVTYQLIVNQASSWLISVGGAYLLGIVLGWGLYGVWIAFALDEIIRGTILLLRWRSGKWIQGAELRRHIIANDVHA
ncbi:MAG: MATE family efflux transporter, partial [Clostridia bacterium]